MDVVSDILNGRLAECRLLLIRTSVVMTDDVVGYLAMGS